MEFFDRVQPDLNMEKLFTMSHRKSIFSSAAVFSVVRGQIDAKIREFRGKIQTKKAGEEIYLRRPEINQSTDVVYVS